VQSSTTIERAAGSPGSPAAFIRRTARTCLSAGLFSAILLFPLRSEAQQTDQATAPPESTRVTVNGVVRNAATGDPLPRALVQIEGDADTGTLTDGEGRFEIPGVAAGPQVFRIVKPGFRDRPYATEETGPEAEGPAHSVLIAAQMPELNFALSPNCAIRGHIELSTGDPAEGMTVNLLKQVVHFGRSVWVSIASTKANGDGVYRFGGLADGVYAVYTQPALESEPAVSVVAMGSGSKVDRSGYPSVFYPDAREIAGASRIRLSGGTQTDANFSLTLEPFYPVTAIAASQNDAPGAAKASQQGGYTAVLMDASAHSLPYLVQDDEATHSLQANLPDGTYVLVVRGFPQPRMLVDGIGDFNKQLRGMGTLAGATEFTVAGHAILGLRILLGPPQVATVHVRFVHGSGSSAAAGNPAEPVNFNVDPAYSVPMNGSEGLWSMDLEPDAINFSAQPGAYWLGGYVPRPGQCADTLTAGSFNLAREPLVLSLANPAPPMELTLRDNCGTLTLTLPPTQATFLPGEEPFYTVYVVPDFDTVADIPPMTMHPSSGPTLNLDNLTPGSYHVYTFDSPVHLEYRNPAALAALPNAGQQVTVSSGTPASLMLEVPEH